MKLILRLLTTASLIYLFLATGCAQQSLPRDEGGIVGSGTRIDCQQQPRHPACDKHVH